MREPEIYEVRGTYTITVAKRVLAHSEEEAMNIAENTYCEICTEWNGNSVFVEGEAASVEADGQLEWYEASTDYIYTNDSDGYDSDSEEYWEDDYDDDEEDEEEE